MSASGLSGQDLHAANIIPDSELTARLTSEYAPGGSHVRLLEGKRLVLTGVATNRSIAFAVARMAIVLGADIVLTSFGRMRRITERAAEELPGGRVDVLELDVDDAAHMAALKQQLAERWEAVDGIVHSIAYAPGDALGGNFLSASATSAEAAFRTSAYSLKALAAGLLPLMRPGGAVVGMDFDATKTWPGYDWMGVAKAALEAVSRYLARELGPAGIRVNLVAAGPLKTPASTAIPGFVELAERWQTRAPLGWRTDAPEVVAGAVCFLLSDLAVAMTGEIVHVDGGFHAVGAGSARRSRSTG